MRLSNDCYGRDLRSFNLALRMLNQEARTHTISVWTKLSPERVRRLSILQRREAHNRKLPRHRGPSPTNLAGVLTSPSLRSEAAALAGFCRILKVIPDVPLANAAAMLPELGRGERLCTAIEVFQALVPHSRITLDQLVLLVVSLAEGVEWGIEGCRRCAALMVVDRLSFDRPVCEDCQLGAAGQRMKGSGEACLRKAASVSEADEPAIEAEQLDLFVDSKDPDESA